MKGGKGGEGKGGGNRGVKGRRRAEVESEMNGGKRGEG